jgi:hypothetical protein
MSSAHLRHRPDATEHHPAYGPYLDAIATPEAPGRPFDLVHHLEAQSDTLATALAPVSEKGALHRYAPGKWSVKEVVAHLTDVERVMAYRMLRIGRGDATPLPGFDENAWIEAGAHDRRPLDEHVAEFHAARNDSLALIRGLPEPAFLNRAVASGHTVTGRALAWILAGHVDHHLRILQERYGVSRPGSANADARDPDDPGTP